MTTQVKAAFLYFAKADFLSSASLPINRNAADLAQSNDIHSGLGGIS